MNESAYFFGIARRTASALRRLAAGTALLVVAGAALAADAGPDLDEARRLLGAGKAAAAAALLERDLLRYAGNAEYDYLLGSAWYQAGRTGPALFAFERVAMVDPGHIDARLKAAQIGIERGSAVYADELLAPLPDLKPNAEQQREYRRLKQLVAAEAGGRLALRGYVAAGIGWDDNVTSGPDRAELTIPSQGAAPIPLGAAGRDHDRMIATEIGLSLRAPLGADTWLVGAGSLRQGDNRRRKDVKEGSANLDLGLLHRSGDDFLGAALLAQSYLLGSSRYRSSLGARANWIRPTGAGSRVTGYLQHIEFDYPEHPIDNAGRTIVGATRDVAANEGMIAWQYGGYGGKEAANDPAKPHFSFRLLGAHLGGSLALRDDLAVSAAAIYEIHRHLALDGLYPDIVRRDTKLALGLAADYRLADRWHLVPRYTYTRNASNLELYRYERNTFALQLRWDFDHGKD